MNISTALNKKYIPYTIVMLTSLCENNPCHIDAYLLSSDLEDSDYADIQTSLSSYDITIHPLNIDKSKFDDKLPRTEKWSIEAYYRLLLWEILPSEVSRILYLDVDIIVNKDIQAMYDTDFEGKEMFVCHDNTGMGKWEDYNDTQRRMLSKMIAADLPYFNSGVLLVNVEAMREKYSFEVYMTAIKEWNYEMFAPDQDILNYVHWENIGYLDAKQFNCYARLSHLVGVKAEDLKQHVSIIHFTGDKPWESSSVHYETEKIWWDYAKKTPIYHQLLEIFLNNAMSDFSLENYINYINNKLIQAQNANAELTDINQRLIAMLQKTS